MDQRDMTRAYFKQSLQLHKEEKFLTSPFLKKKFHLLKFLTNFFSHHSLRLSNKKVNFHLLKFLTTSFSHSPEFSPVPKYKTTTCYVYSLPPCYFTQSALPIYQTGGCSVYYTCDLSRVTDFARCRLFAQLGHTLELVSGDR